MNQQRFDEWMVGLEERHFADLRFAEVTRALRALSSTYVERRDRLETKSAFDSAGKRAAYALYYSPLHFLTVQHVVRALAAGVTMTHLLDVGCGAGAAGAAWAVNQEHSPAVSGIDAHPWALSEATATYRSFRIDGTARRGNVLQLVVPRATDAIVVGWVLNEVGDAARQALQRSLVEAVSGRRRLLVIEPIATRVAPWWDAWSAPFVAAGGRLDEWRFQAELPDVVRRLGRAAGLRSESIAARTLFV
jgi:hypothetical protein